MASDRLRHLLRRPVAVAPMAGGVTTPALVVAAAEAGAVGFLAGGYKSAADLRGDIDTVRTSTSEPFGVNLFVPGAPTRRPRSVAAYVSSLASDASVVGGTVGDPVWDDDSWAAKIDMVMADPPPLVTFTFGCPPSDVVAELRARGATVGVTVTSVVEARRGVEAGADCLCVQGAEAGAHHGTFANRVRPGGGRRLLPLLAEVTTAVDVPVIAAGGIMDRAGLEAALDAGAAAVQCGTAFLRCPESGAHPAYKAALADGRFTTTAVTRAFSGRPARALVNRFVVDHGGAPPAYPEINNATRPLRAAAAQNADADRMSLWAGTGFRLAADRPAADVVEHLCPPTPHRAGRERPRSGRRRLRP